MKRSFVPAPRVREVQALFLAAPEWLRPIVELSAATGMQPTDIANLRWGDIQPDRHNGRVAWAARRGKPPVCLPQSALAAVLPLSAPSRRCPIFPGVTASRARSALRRASRRAGVRIGFLELRSFAITAYVGFLK